jgi:hypothetical protein
MPEQRYEEKHQGNDGVWGGHMSRITQIAIAAYIVIFCSFPILHSKFLNDHHILFWILAVEHIAMIPISIKAFIDSIKNTRILLSFCIGALATSFLLLFTFFLIVSELSDRGMGIVAFLLFPLAEAVLAVVGAICGLAYIVKKMSGRYDNKSHTNTP